MTVLSYAELLDPSTGTAWTTRQDLVNASTSATIDQFITDDGGTPNGAYLIASVKKAEQKAISLLLRAFSLDEINTLMKVDDFARLSVVDMTLEYLSRRKTSFTSEDGKGRYFQQFTEAVKYFESLSHGRTKTSANVSNVQEGGMVGPRQPVDPNIRNTFIFSDPVTGRTRGF